MEKAFALAMLLVAVSTWDPQSSAAAQNVQVSLPRQEFPLWTGDAPGAPGKETKDIPTLTPIFVNARLIWIRRECAKKPYPATRYRCKIATCRHRSRHIAFYQQLQGGDLLKEQLRNGNQSFLSFEAGARGLNYATFLGASRSLAGWICAIRDQLTGREFEVHIGWTAEEAASELKRYRNVMGAGESPPDEKQ